MGSKDPVSLALAGLLSVRKPRTIEADLSDADGSRRKTNKKVVAQSKKSRHRVAAISD